MQWFIKTEFFTEKTKSLSSEERKIYLKKHLDWTKSLKKKGVKLYSGYLTNKNGVPGGGGLLVFQAKSFELANELIQNDPMIKEGLVEWKLQKWVLISGDLS